MTRAFQPLPRRACRIRSQRTFFQRGAMMLEVLISVLLLSLGILGIVALQASMTANVSDARYRAEAALLGEQIIGTMWGDIPALPAYRINESADETDCPNFSDTTSANESLQGWLGNPGDVSTVAGLLPEGRARINATVDPASAENGLVIITICWRPPQEDPSTWGDPKTWRHHTTTTQIRT